MPENTVRPEVKQEDYPCLYLFPHHHQFWQHSQLQNQSLLKPCEVMSSLSKSLSLSSTQQELTVDDIEDFDDDDDLDEVDSRRYSRRVLNDAADFVLGLPPFAIGNMMLKEQIEMIFRDNTILKRAVAIQHERQKEFNDKNQEVHQLKQLIVQYQEQLRTLELKDATSYVIFSRLNTL